MRSRTVLRCGCGFPIGALRRHPAPIALIAMLTSGMAGCGGQAHLAPVAPGLLALTPSGSDGLAATIVPTAGPSPTPVAAPTRVVQPPEPLTLPAGFGIGVFRDSLGPVRMLAIAPNGDIFASVPELNRIIVLPDRDSDGVADASHVYLEGDVLNRPYGLAFHDQWLYVAAMDAVLRIAYEPGDLSARSAPELLLPLPGEGLHQSRSILFAPDGSFYLSVGSSCNVCVEQDVRRASILKIEDGGAKVVRFGSGIRNAVGLALGADGRTVWFTDNERDLFAEDRPADELNLLVPGADYGWPGCFGHGQPDPAAGGTVERCAGTVGPAVEFLAHAGASGIAFYTDDRFPAEYRGGLFVALHGSWSRAIPVGYAVVYVPFAEGAPIGPPQPFVEGWLRPDTRRWASPVDIVLAPDGALLVSDDGGGRIYRIFYDGPLSRPTARFSR